MVDHDQKGIEASGKGEVGDGVMGDLLEGSEGGGANGGKWGNGRMGIGFVLLAGCTALNIFTNIGSKARPPKFSCDELASFQVARVASGFVVMAALEDGVTEGVVIGDIDTVLVG